jgi:hypothetical protein
MIRSLVALIVRASTPPTPVAPRRRSHPAVTHAQIRRATLSQVMSAAGSLGAPGPVVAYCRSCSLHVRKNSRMAPASVSAETGTSWSLNRASESRIVAMSNPTSTVAAISSNRRVPLRDLLVQHPSSGSQGRPDTADAVPPPRTTTSSACARAKSKALPTSTASRQHRITAGRRSTNGLKQRRAAANPASVGPARRRQPIAATRSSHQGARRIDRFTHVDNTSRSVGADAVSVLYRYGPARRLRAGRAPSGTRTSGSATTREYQGNRSVAARPVAKSTGSEMCSCVVNHRLFDRWQQLVARTHDPTSRPFLSVPLARLSQWATAISPLVEMFRSRISMPIGPW